ncbi:hypothetical protein [Pleomorphomonas koreensis]|uniref:hypothetical protein n=1 Tax=Pleomorphomonas koreensis TaxID=257440 RepID=UPI00041899D7|nr:hypothetical protein [Pleomorphomonas koreensis]
MDIGSAKPVLAGVTSPVPKAPSEQSQSTATDLAAAKAVKMAEKTDGRSVDASADKPKGEAASSNALTAANTIKASPRDEVSGFDLFSAEDGKASAKAETADSPANASVVQDNQEFALRLQAMIEAWGGTGGTPRSAVFDQKV